MFGFGKRMRYSNSKRKILAILLAAVVSGWDERRSVNPLNNGSREYCARAAVHLRSTAFAAQVDSEFVGLFRAECLQGTKYFVANFSKFDWRHSCCASEIKLSDRVCIESFSVVHHSLDVRFYLIFSPCCDDAARGIFNLNCVFDPG